MSRDLTSPEAWRRVSTLLAHKPATWDHPVWRGRGPRATQWELRDDDGDVRAWVLGDGTNSHPYVVELTGTFTLDEVLGALTALTLEGAMFALSPFATGPVPLVPWLVAGFGEEQAQRYPLSRPGALLVQQVSAVPGSEAEARLKLSGGVAIGVRPQRIQHPT